MNSILTRSIRLLGLTAILLGSMSSDIVRSETPYDEQEASEYDVDHSSNKSQATVKPSSENEATRINNMYQLSRGLLDAGFYQHASGHALKAYHAAKTSDELPLSAKIVVENNLAVVSYRMGDYQRARNLLQQSALRLANSPDHSSSWTKRQLSVIYANLFELNRLSGKHLEAEQNLRKLITIDMQLYPVAHPKMLHNYSLLTGLYIARRQWSQAGKLLDEYIAYIPKGIVYREARVEAELLRSKMYANQSLPNKAEQCLLHALAMQSSYKNELLAEIYKELAEFYSKSHYSMPEGKANHYHRKQITMLERVYGVSHPLVADAIVQFSALRKNGLSINNKARVLSIYTQSYGQLHSKTLSVRKTLRIRDGLTKVVR